MYHGAKEERWTHTSHLLAHIISAGYRTKRLQDHLDFNPALTPAEKARIRYLRSRLKPRKRCNIPDAKEAFLAHGFKVKVMNPSDIKVVNRDTNDSSN